MPAALESSGTAAIALAVIVGLAAVALWWAVCSWRTASASPSRAGAISDPAGMSRSTPRRGGGGGGGGAGLRQRLGRASVAAASSSRPNQHGQHGQHGRHFLSRRMSWEGAPVEYLVLADNVAAQAQSRDAGAAVPLTSLEAPLHALRGLGSESAAVSAAIRSARTPPRLAGAPASMLFSLVVPAYNEAARLPAMLDEALAFLDAHVPDRDYEVLVADDGSADTTCARAAAVFAAHIARTADPASPHVPHFAIVRLPRNSGKGAAVRVGMMHARGELVLFADADGATRFADLKLLLAKVHLPGDVASDADDDKAPAAGRRPRPPTKRSPTPAGSLEERFFAFQEAAPLPPSLVIGSRTHLVKTEAVVKRSVVRNLLMYGFHSVLWVLAGGLRDIGDTQCGFKLASRAAAQLIVPGLHVKGWIFDIELLMVARILRIPTTEVCVTWHEIDGSKMRLAADSIRMLVDLLVIRAAYLTGVWTVAGPEREDDDQGGDEHAGSDDGYDVVDERPVSR